VLPLCAEELQAAAEEKRNVNMRKDGEAMESDRGDAAWSEKENVHSSQHISHYIHPFNFLSLRWDLVLYPSLALSRRHARHHLVPSSVRFTGTNLANTSPGSVPVQYATAVDDSPNTIFMKLRNTLRYSVSSRLEAARHLK